MRTHGTFQDVYEAAKGYYNGEETDNTYGGKPINAVVRRERGTWMLESGLHSSDGDFEISLDTFDAWFYYGYSDSGYMPTEADIKDFMSAMEND